MSLYENLKLLILLFVIGSCLGSFFILVGSRTARKQSVITPRSRCDTCKQILKWYELIPILSWFILRGKCRNCGSSISVWYVVFEIISGISMVISCYLLMFSSEITICMTFFYFLLAITVSDIEMMKIPNRVLIFFLIFGLVEQIIIFKSIFLLLKSITSLVIIFFAMYLFSCISQGGIGGGDIKLLAVMGIYLGVYGVVVTLFVASILGLAYALSIGLVKIKGRKIPFGPFLAVAGLIVYFFMSGQFNYLMLLLKF